MPSFMIIQSIFSVKTFLAVFTRKRLFSSMGSFVALSPTFLRKLFITMSTGKWFVTCMKPFNLEIFQDLNFSLSILFLSLSGHLSEIQAGVEVVKIKKSWFFLLGLKYTLRTCFDSKKFLSKSCPELSNQVLSFSACQI